MALAGSNRKPALTAAASKIGYSRATTGKLREESWQERAWTVYDRLPAVFYMTRYRSDIASKIDYFVATIDEPGLDPEVEETGPGTKVLEAEGGPELLRRIVSEFIVHWDIPGEGYLTRFDTEPFWRVLSTQELKKEGDRFIWGDDQNQMGRIEADQVYRVWDPHPRFHWEADSPVRHILEEAEELILLSRTAKVQSMSQVSAGILILPDTVDLSPFAEDEEGTEDDVARWLLDVLARPVTDTGSSQSVTPAVMTMHGDDISKVRHLTFARDWEINLELRKELLAAVATGLDLPPEVLTGMADLNHWTAWQVSESAVDQHVLPSVDAILDSLTTNWFRPLLEASGVDPEGYVLWRDPSPATVSPDQSDVAIRLYEADAISGEAVRRVSNFDETDAPTPEELDEKTARRSQSQQGVPTDGPPIQAALDPEFVNRVAEALWRVQEGDPPLVRAAVTAAARRRIVASELADIDTELLAWVVEESEKEIERILAKIGKSITAATDPIEESWFTRLTDRLDSRIEQAQAAARGWVERLTGRPADIGDESVFRSQGIQLIIGGIMEAIRNRLFTPGPTPDPIDVGKLPEPAVPMRAIREGLSQAGGGPAIYEANQTSELVGNGAAINQELNRNGFSPEAYVWRYGHPKHSFEPHRRLNDVQFDSWESPKLLATERWGRIGEFYRPDDHDGCQCIVEQVLVEAFQPIEGRDTSGTGNALGFEGSPLNSEGGTLRGKAYGFTVDPDTGKVTRRQTIDRAITGLENVPEHRRAEFQRIIDDALDEHHPAFRTPNVHIEAESRFGLSGQYDSFGVFAGGTDRMTLNRRAFMDDNGNWYEDKVASLREVVIHENGHRTNTLADLAAPNEIRAFNDLARSEIKTLSAEIADSHYVTNDMTQMVYPVSLERGLLERSGNVARETFAEVNAFTFDNNLGNRYAGLRDAAQEVIDATFSWLNA